MATSENELPIRLVIVNRDEVDKQLSDISRDRNVGGGGGGRSGSGRSAGGPVPIRGGVVAGRGGNVSSGIVEGASGVGTAAAIRGGGIGAAGAGGGGGAKGLLSKIGGGSAVAGGVIAGGIVAALAELKRSFSTLTQATVQALDPNATRGQRQLNVARAFATRSIVGDKAFQAAEPFIQAGFGAQFRTESEGAASTTAKFDRAFEGIGLQNPNKSVSELEEIIKRDFGGDIDAFGEQEIARARGREAGRQVVAERTGDGLDFGEAKKQIGQQAKKAGEDVRQFLKDVLGGSGSPFEDAANKLKDAASDLKDAAKLNLRVNPGRTR